MVRVFNRKSHVVNKEILEYLEQVDLEKYGFKKTVEVTSETVKNGKKTTKRMIHYRVTDDCSRVKYWDDVLEKLMPKKWQLSEIFSTAAKEVQSRISGRKTKSCSFGLEIHTNTCSNDDKASGVSKRSVAKGKSSTKGCRICIGVCSTSTIQYRGIYVNGRKYYGFMYNGTWTK